MPPELRRRHEALPPPPPEQPFSESEEEYVEATFEEGGDLEHNVPDLDEGEEEAEEAEEAEEDDEHLGKLKCIRHQYELPFWDICSVWIANPKYCKTSIDIRNSNLVLDCLNFCLT